MTLERLGGAALPLLDPMLRRPVWIFLALSGVMVAIGSTHLTSDNDWLFFSWGSDMLFGQHREFVRTQDYDAGTADGGLELYANYPFLQIGPPALLLASVLQFGSRDGLLLAGVVIQALGVVTVLLLGLTARRQGRLSALSLLVGGAASVTAWGFITHFRHLDDALTLTGLAGAAVLITRERYSWAAVVLGVAAASKPWGVVCIVLVLAAPDLGQRARALAVAVGTAGIIWSPFVLAAPATLLLGDVGLSVSPMSALSALSVGSLPDPSGLRLIQLGAGLLLASALVLRGHWALAPLAAFVFRLLIEPSVYEYYIAAVVVAALLADLAWLGRGPVLTMLAMAGWSATLLVPAHAGAFRAATYASLLLIAVLALRTGRAYVPSSRPPKPVSASVSATAPS